MNTPGKLLFYRHFVDITINKEKEQRERHYFQILHKYHPKMNLTIEENLSNCLDMKIVNNNGNITTKVYRRTSKLHVHSSSRAQKQCNRNVLPGDFH